MENSRKPTKPKLFFAKINNIDKSLAKMTRKKGKMQITNIRNEGWDIPTDPMGNKRVIRENYEQLYVLKLDNTDDMKTNSFKHIKHQNSLKDKMDHLNQPSFIEEIIINYNYQKNSISIEKTIINNNKGAIPI